MSIVDDAVEDGVGEGGLTDQIVPAVDRDLAGDQGGAAAVAVLDDLEHIVTLLGPEGLEAPIVENEQLDAAERTHQPRIAAIAAGSELEAAARFDDRRAIAVLPFLNFSDDAEQEYFADGITEDMISMLAGWRAFPVVARDSTFTFKGKAVDIKKVGAQLGARYVVEGSVRKSGHRVRITAQLIRTDTGHHIMAERFD